MTLPGHQLKDSSLYVFVYPLPILVARHLPGSPTPIRHLTTSFIGAKKPMTDDRALEAGGIKVYLQCPPSGVICTYGWQGS